MAAGGKKTTSSKTKKPKIPRQFWTMKPITKVKPSAKAGLSKTACRAKQRHDEISNEKDTD